MEIKTLTQDDYDIIIDLWKMAGLSYRPNGRDSKKEICRHFTEKPRAFPEILRKKTKRFFS
ncbi:MAG: hypothetical protein COS08_07955 [Euryarchaeota archaeon CG01_land_8_20_14_3_00_38_12]|nr:MAG: hypothetical protein COS08_07955 [Euryarchaeota archaeon CG01_land_8_20_14_3_00_38_12]PJB22247.1 MAG: hypothetical protein CO114_01095 [Euryarchaeota archaeon CG_4_9_14_3_um_filter_38_12]